MTALHDGVIPLLGESTGWRLLALLLSRPRPGWSEEVGALAAEAGADETLRRAAAAAVGAGEGAYHAILGAGGVASPREAAHAGFLDPGRILADLAARYAAFGFSPRGEEPDDHLAVECDFVAYLFLKEAYARARGQPEAAEVTSEARRRFLAEHLTVAGHALGRKLPDGAPPHLVAAARALAARLPAGPADPDPARAPDDDPLSGGCPASCSGCDG
jgi:nitrate reductase assembly molybdenum cofactor insertion protein NarJ